VVFLLLLRVWTITSVYPELFFAQTNFSRSLEKAFGLRVKHVKRGVAQITIFSKFLECFVERGRTVEQGFARSASLSKLPFGYRYNSNVLITI